MNAPKPQTSALARLGTTGRQKWRSQQPSCLAHRSKQANTLRRAARSSVAAAPPRTALVEIRRAIDDWMVLLADDRGRGRSIRVASSLNTYYSTLLISAPGCFQSRSTTRCQSTCQTPATLSDYTIHHLLD